ncbi:hypothetical protein DAPPUDRAFT_325899 [Daphnia pulex]|uniref:Membrane protein BRI3 n=1 Tax=Daphnia pulex TaxID=6669 RepID=E9H639_DAPPU|nr:hypothetical protein DAPPUDRAFT_325899 [Daphnia pulex]|eukprot:EFX72794.1 hypothetical protein DAPPUDRAFT_325899 [Daphnia pulex]
MSDEEISAVSREVPNVAQRSTSNTATVIDIGGSSGNTSCKMCHNGCIKSHFSCFGVFCAIVCFPLGLLCLFCTKEYRCTSCGACV